MGIWPVSNEGNLMQESHSSNQLSSKPVVDLFEGSDVSGIPLRSLRNLIYKRQLEVIHIGRRIYLRTKDLEVLVNEGTNKDALVTNRTQK